MFKVHDRPDRAATLRPHDTWVFPFVTYLDEVTDPATGETVRETVKAFRMNRQRGGLVRRFLGRYNRMMNPGRGRVISLIWIDA